MRFLFLILSCLCVIYAILLLLFCFFKKFFLPWFLLSILLFFIYHIFNYNIIIKGITITITFIISLIMIYYGVHILSTIDYSKKDFNVDYLLILGASVKGDIPSDILRYRLEKSVKWLNTHEVKKVILSGGKAFNENISEAEAMFLYLTSRNISPDILILEKNSINTRENLVLSNELINDKNAKIGFLSNDFHLYRVMRTANQLGMKNLFPIGASTPNCEYIYRFIREIFVLFIWDVKNVVNKIFGKKIFNI